MLSENIKTIRKARGLSQEGLAVQLHVVRQTISKWEQGISVPDADLLIALAEALEVPVSTLLGETAAPPPTDDWRALSEKLEAINLQLARRKAARRALLHGLSLALCAVLAAGTILLLLWHSPYLSWDYADPETAVVGVALHAFEWFFVRIAPPLFLVAVIGACLTRRRG